MKTNSLTSGDSKQIKICSMLVSTILIPLLMAFLAGGCATDDLGLCTIQKSGDDDVYEEITIEECQEIFGNTVGARGWSWDPQD